MRGKKRVQTTITVDREVLDILRSEGHNISGIARRILNQTASEAWDRNALNTLDVESLHKLVEITEEIIDSHIKEVSMLRKFIAARKEELLELGEEERPKLKGKRHKDPNKHPIIQLVESFAIWFKVFEKEKGPFSEDDQGLYPDWVYSAFRNDYPEEGITLSEVIEENGRVDALEWLHKAAGFPLTLLEEEDDGVS